jgi:cytosine/adenosine deaminase-related metal-dependent hydrolase
LNSDSSREPICMTARWVFPVDRPPLEGGLITVGGQRILSVEPKGSRRPDIDFGQAAILPGLVNAHTHLDLSDMRGQARPRPDFIGWLREVIAHRRDRRPEHIRADVKTAAVECLKSGTTLIGDIAGQGTSHAVLAEMECRSVVFFELLGLTSERAHRAWTSAESWLAAAKETGKPTRPGLSPHAPYSVSQSLFERAAQAHVPIAIHLAESPAEQDLLERRDGLFVDFLKELEVWAPDELVAGWAALIRLFERCDHVLWIHANYLDPTMPIPLGHTVVYCPRTHAAFGHGPHPFREFLRAGVRVALGTDSLASNPDLDLLAEARFVHRNHPDLAGDIVLRMATLSGAEALGFGEETGSLTPGKSADLIVVPLPDKQAAEPHELLFQSEYSACSVLYRGQWINVAAR